MKTQGKFISFEGGEGCGKSTQVGLLAGELSRRNIDYILTREPGGTPLAERIRPLLVEPSDEDWEPLAETLLFFAARVQHVEQVIKPALAEGKWVICDRFSDSTFVYQGIAKGLGVSYLQNLQNSILNEFVPDKTVLLDIDPAVGLKRAAGRGDGEDRFEKLDISFHQKLRDGFLQLAEDDRFTVIDASQDIADIHVKIVEALL